MRTLARFGVLCAAATSAATAHADELVDATDPARLATIIRELGYRAKLEKDAVGDPIIHSSVGGTDFSILFYGCENNRGCKLLLYQVGYDLPDGTSHDVVDDWNETKLVGRAYIDDESDPWLEMTVNMDAGVSRRNFEDTFDWWEISVDAFEEHVEF